MTAPQEAPRGEPVQQELDPAFNAGLSPSTPGSSRSLSPPRRPDTPTRAEPRTDGLETVLQPVRDGLSLPEVEREYTVRSGDTLSAIATRHGVTLSDLMSANGLSRNATIYVGQTLLIPESSPAGEPGDEAGERSSATVTVARGDTLSAIAARHGTTIAVLKRLNNLSGDTIFVGQELVLPAGAAAPPRPDNSRTGAARPSAFGGPTGSYTVQPGDTPSGIARQYGISAAELMAANNITDPRRLFVGQELVVPGRPAASAAREPAAQPRSSAPQRSDLPTTTTPSRTLSPPRQPEPDPAGDPLQGLEALEEEDLPFVEVEVVEEEEPPQN